MDENAIARMVVDTCMHMHQDLGPGLLESVYEGVLSQLLESKGCCIQRQVPVSIQYRGLKFADAFRADIIVNNLVILELKSVESLNKAHYKQTLTYLKLTNLKLGLLLNFGAPLMRDGIVRFVNNLPESP